MLSAAREFVGFSLQRTVNSDRFLDAELIGLFAHSIFSDWGVSWY